MISQLIIEYPDNFPDAVGKTPEAFQQEAKWAMAVISVISYQLSVISTCA